MSQEIFSIAIFQPLSGNEEATLLTMRALIAALSTGGYSRDLLYRDTKAGNEYILLRYWKSEAARRAALEDPKYCAAGPNSRKRSEQSRFMKPSKKL